jgi:hypothetical protein
VRVDILPYLALAASMTVDKAAILWEQCRRVALRRNHGRDDTRTFVLAVEAFRQRRPFEITSLPMDRSRDGLNGPPPQRA